MLQWSKVERLRQKSMVLDAKNRRGVHEYPVNYMNTTFLPLTMYMPAEVIVSMRRPVRS